MEGLEKILSPTSKESAAYVKYAKPLDVMQAHVAKGQLHAYQGEMTKAVEEWEIAYLIAVEEVPQAVPQMDEMLGIGYLHKSEIENEVYRNPGRGAFFRCLRGSDMRNRPVLKWQSSISLDISRRNPTSSK